MGAWYLKSSQEGAGQLACARYTCYTCLAVSGSMLLCGGVRDQDSGLVVVLDSKTMDRQHTLRLEHAVHNLLSVQSEVWGVLGGGNVVVWGKAERGQGSGKSEAGRA